MSLPEKISADYTLSPNDLTEVLTLLVEDRRPAMVWGPAGAAKSQIAQQVAAATNRRYVDIRALLHEPVDLRGIPWRDSSDRTRWASPDFLPPADDPGHWLLNLEELPSAVPMVQAALYQLVLDRKIGEYTLPEGASLIACGNRETDRGIVHRRSGCRLDGSRGVVGLVLDPEPLRKPRKGIAIPGAGFAGLSGVSGLRPRELAERRKPLRLHGGRRRGIGIRHARAGRALRQRALPGVVHVGCRAAAQDQRPGQERGNRPQESCDP